jgi:hypothetical protein
VIIYSCGVMTNFGIVRGQHPPASRPGTHSQSDRQIRRYFEELIVHLVLHEYGHAWASVAQHRL